MKVPLDRLNEPQREAVQTLQGPILILAGAGTGKTRVITVRIAYMIAHGIEPARILGVTFTNKAAREMLERVQGLLQWPRSVPRRKRPLLCTFHSWCVRILREYGERLGYRRDFVIYDESDQLGVIRRLLSQYYTQETLPKPEVFLGWLSAIRNGADWIVDRMEKRWRSLLEDLQKKYTEALRACNAMDFDDLLCNTLKLFQNHPDVLDQCRQRWQHVMVDEYQDTNPLQFQLVRLLCEEHRNLCVVGDDDQSIYGWRGAAVRNILDFEKYFPEAKVIKLEQNYRSVNSILRASNALIRNNPNRREKQLWSARGEGQPVRVIEYKDEEAEAKAIAAKIHAAHTLDRKRLSSFAILYRTNSQSRPLEAALRRAGLRYRVVGGQSFFDRREVRDFMAFLRVALNPDDDISLLRIVNVPPRGLSSKTIQKLMAEATARGCSVFQAMKSEEVRGEFLRRIASRIEAFVAMLEHWQAALEQRDPEKSIGMHLEEWAERWMQEIGYFEELVRAEKDPETGENRVLNVKELIQSMDREYESEDPREALAEFVADLSLESEIADEEDWEGEAVTLITLHSAKGLEFPHVFIVGVEEGILPHARSKEEETLEEERRLLYVGMTRAMQTLELSYCRGRRKHGRIVPAHPSRFLQELPEEGIHHEKGGQGSQTVSSDRSRQWFEAIRGAIRTK